MKNSNLSRAFTISVCTMCSTVGSIIMEEAGGLLFAKEDYLPFVICMFEYAAVGLLLVALLCFKQLHV